MTAEEAMAAALQNRNDPNRAVIGGEGENPSFLYRLRDLHETEIGTNRLYSAVPLPRDTVIFGPRCQRCTIIVGATKSGQFKIYVSGADHVVYIGGSKRFQGKVAIEGERNLFFFADQATCNFASFVISGQDRSVIFGTDCMLSFGISVRNTDSHAIFLLQERTVTNAPKSVLVHPHVWVGEGAKILKGVTIEIGAIVAANATVVGDVPARSIAVGLPAKIVEATKGKVSWTRKENPTADDMQDVVDSVRRRGVVKSLIDTLLSKPALSPEALKSDHVDIEEFADLGGAMGTIEQEP